MKAFLITAGTVFGLIVVVHMFRMGAEPQLAKDPWFWLITVAAGALSFWAWRLVWQLNRQSAA